MSLTNMLHDADDSRDGGHDPLLALSDDDDGLDHVSGIVSRGDRGLGSQHGGGGRLMLDVDTTAESTLDGDDIEFRLSNRRTTNSKRFSRREWFLIFVCLTLFFLICALVGIVAYWRTVLVSGSDDDGEEGHETMCTSAPCIRLAADYYSMMDMTADPCEDFFQFSCGGWLNRTAIDPGRSSANIFQQVSDLNADVLRRKFETLSQAELGSVAERKALDWYRACMNETRIHQQGVQPLLRVIQQLSLNISTNDSGWTLDAFLPDLLVWYKLPFLPIGVYVDDKNSSQYVIVVSQASLLLQAREFYLERSDHHTALLAALKRKGVSLLSAVGLRSADLNRTMDRVLAMETELAAVMLSPAELRNTSAVYRRSSLGAIAANFSRQLNLIAGLNKLVNTRLNLTGLTLTAESAVNYYSAHYLASLPNIMANWAVEDLRAYLALRIVNLYSQFLAGRFEEIHIEFQRVYSGAVGRPERWRRCLSDADLTLPMAVSRIFLASVFPGDRAGTRRRVDSLVEDIRAEFRVRIGKQAWMDGATRRHALDKLEHVSKFLFAPDYVYDADAVDEHYDQLQVGADHVQNQLAWAFAATRENWHHLQTSPNRSHWPWDVGPATVNAFYDPSQNSINIPAGILQSTFFRQYSPLISPVYGGIGVAIGHEFTHGFDDTGSQFDAAGNLRDWFTAASQQGFRRMSGCMRRHYSQFGQGSLRVNGSLTLGEDLADAGGIRLAWGAYQRALRAAAGGGVRRRQRRLPGIDLNEDQLFFLSIGQAFCAKMHRQRMEQLLKTDPHTPGKFRVWGFVRNFAEFGRVFGCRRNSYMTPLDHCTVW